MSEQMAVKRAPGPLFVRHGDNGYFDIMEGDNPQTASVVCTRFEWKERAAELHHLGNLMAAAPDLLAALKYARRMVKVTECDIEFIDAAIAKATAP